MITNFISVYLALIGDSVAVQKLNQSNTSNQMLVFEKRGKPEYPEKKPILAG